MKIFVDSANLAEIKEAVSLGIVDGVTTNPSLVAKEGTGLDFKEHMLKICEILNNPKASVSAEVVSLDYDAMVAEGRELVKIHPSVYVKLPMTKAGLQATKTLSSEGIRINQTLIFTAAQALLSAKAGSSFVSPFIGRLDDIGTSGMNLWPMPAGIWRDFELRYAQIASTCVAACPSSTFGNVLCPFGQAVGMRVPGRIFCGSMQ